MSWSGKVVESIFRGPRTSITVETGGPRLHIEAQALAGLRVGDDVHIAVSAGGAWAIGPEGGRKFISITRSGLRPSRRTSRRRKALRPMPRRAPR